jgi:hypothetical protein
VASPYPSKIDVSGLRRGHILDVNLKLRDYSHAHAMDVGVLLVGPRGQNAIVMSDVDEAGVSDINLVLDDEAANPLAAPLVSGTYQPTNYDSGVPDHFPSPAPTPSGNTAPSVFDGTNPNGTWKLFVVDKFLGRFGEFGDVWALTIKAKVRT